MIHDLEAATFARTNLVAEVWSNETAVAIADGGARELTWIYDMDYYVDASAEGGSVDVAPGWRSGGATLTMTATPDPGHYFSHWDPAVPGVTDEAIFTNSVSLAMDPSFAGVLRLKNQATAMVAVATEAMAHLAAEPGTALVKTGAGTLYAKPYPGYYPGAIEIHEGPAVFAGNGPENAPGLFGPLRRRSSITFTTCVWLRDVWCSSIRRGMARGRGERGSSLRWRSDAPSRTCACPGGRSLSGRRPSWCVRSD